MEGPPPTPDRTNLLLLSFPTSEPLNQFIDVKLTFTDGQLYTLTLRVLFDIFRYRINKSDVVVLMHLFLDVWGFTLKIHGAQKTSPAFIIIEKTSTLKTFPNTSEWKQQQN